MVSGFSPDNTNSVGDKVGIDTDCPPPSCRSDVAIVGGMVTPGAEDSSSKFPSESSKVASKDDSKEGADVGRSVARMGRR